MCFRSEQLLDIPTWTAALTPRVFYKTAPATKTYDTVNECLFCQKSVRQKIKRHLILVHRDKPEVAAALMKPKREQAKAFTYLMNRGNFEHNKRVLEQKKGELYLRRRPKSSTIPISSFLPCPGCLAFMTKSCLPRHASECDLVDPGTANLTARAEAIMNKFQDGETPDCVRTIRNAELRDVIMTDESLMAYAKYTVGSKGKSENQTKSLKARLTLMAKLLLRVRDLKGEDLTIADICAPSYFDDIIRATMDIAGHDDGTELQNPTFERPSVPREIGHALGKVAHVMVGRAIRRGDGAAEKKVEDFLRLRDAEWGDRITRASLHTVNVRSMKKDNAIPSTEDMKTLMTYLNTELKRRTEALQASASKKTYNDLTELTAVFLMVLNKRRGSETVKIKLTDFTERVDHTQNETVLQSLSAAEKNMVRVMTLIKTLGKRGRVVPVLLPNVAKDAVETLISAREAVGVPDCSLLLFAKANIRTCLHPHTTTTTRTTIHWQIHPPLSMVRRRRTQ